jgi:hypothetical protein
LVGQLKIVNREPLFESRAETVSNIFFVLWPELMIKITKKPGGALRYILKGRTRDFRP